MGIWKRFSDWWWGIPATPLEQDEYGNTVIWPVGEFIHRKAWRVIRPAFCSLSHFLTFLIISAFVGLIGWAVFVYMKDLTGLG